MSLRLKGSSVICKGEKVKHVDMVKTTCRNLSDFVHGVVVGARQVRLSISEYRNFPTKPSLQFTENGLKKKKYPVNSNCG